MSDIDKLIEKLCPDGVQYKELCDVGKVLRGKRLTKNQLSDDEKYPVFHGGLEPLGYYGFSNRNANTVMVINVGASAGTVGYSSRNFWSSDGCFCIEPKEFLLSRYIYHVLIGKENILCSKVRVAGIPTLDATVLEKTRIPIPPLPIQQEIVNILDKFTQLEAELEAELKAELEARKVQYEYYMTHFLTFDNNIEWESLGKLCSINTGIKPVQEMSMNGNYPYINAGIKPSGFVNNTNTSLDCVTIPSRGQGGAGYVCYQNTDFWNGPLSYAIKSSSEKIRTKFIFFYLKSIQEKIIELRQTGSIPAINRKELVNVLIPTIPLDVQDQIIAFLDKLDNLTNNLNMGLTAEIAARKKQYEYYRNKLLTFKPLQNG